MPAETPTLSDLYRLAEQLELDTAVPAQSARERDHAIAQRCGARDDTGRLLCWLAAVSAQNPGASQPRERWLTEASAAALGRMVALGLGFSGMATFLLASGRGLVNVFLFMLLFVIVQVLLCLVAAAVMARSVSGARTPAVLPINPARLVAARLFPDRRYLREAQSVVRLVFLRYGQELGALFTLGAIAAFFVVLALSDFTFVWGSTFALSDTLVGELCALLATPWAAWLPAATVSDELVFASRFHPALTTLSPADINAMRGWWPFLIMSMVSYALLPRLLLWLCSRLFFTRQIRAAFAAMPGSERVLARMKAPVVTTQGPGRGSHPGVDRSDTAIDPGLLLLNWANALSPQQIAGCVPFAAVAPANIVHAGLGPLPLEMERLANIFSRPLERLYVVAKSWEPPMADLADMLAEFAAVPRCTLFLAPLPNRPVSAAKLADWQVFARGLAFAVVDVQVLEPGQMSHVNRMPAP